MAFDAHDRAFASFKDACKRWIYDNMKTAVAAIPVGKDRACNRRFLQMCGRYLVERWPARWPRARRRLLAIDPIPSGTAADRPPRSRAGAREPFFSPRLRVKSYGELSARLLDQCIAYAKAHPQQACRIGQRLCDRPAVLSERKRCRSKLPTVHRPKS